MGCNFQNKRLTTSSGDIYAGIGFTRRFVRGRVSRSVAEARINGTTQSRQAAVCGTGACIEHSRKYGNGRLYLS